MIKIAIDTSPLKDQSRFRGVGFYTKKLLEGLGRQSEVEVIKKTTKTIPENVDLIHYPFFTPFFISLPVLSNKKFVVTIHDLTPLIFPEAYPPGIKGRTRFLIQKLLLSRASRVITDSENSKKDIVSFLNYPADKIDVIYLAPVNKVKKTFNKNFLAKLTVKFKLPVKFALYVGDVNYNKNLPGLIKACRLVSLPLVLVGKQAVQSVFDHHHVENQPLVELNRLTEGKNDILKLGFVSEKDLSGLYSLASVYCQPSYYEGFGLSIVEAMESGCPVVTSNVSSMPEVVGEAALLINPSKIEEISAGIRKVLGDRTLRLEMIEKGYKQAGKFSWEKTIRKTLVSYQKALRDEK